MPRRLDGERRNSLPTHLSESESERAVGMWTAVARNEKGMEGEGVRVSVKAKESKPEGSFFFFFFKQGQVFYRHLVFHTPCVLNLKKSIPVNLPCGKKDNICCFLRRSDICVCVCVCVCARAHVRVCVCIRG